MFELKRDSFRLAQAFTISRGTKNSAEVLTLTLTNGSVSGRGECVPYARYNETLRSVEEQIEAFYASDGAVALPAGAARNAVDCATWDLRAKAEAKPVWEQLRLAPPQPVTTAYTLSLDSPEAMRNAAAAQAHRPLLKLKLGTPEDMPRLEAVREAAPRADIIVDANEGWSIETYSELAPHLVRLGVRMVEQPLPAGDDDALREIERPLPVCADESCHDLASLPSLKGKYDMINIKLDKTGGLTEALRLKSEARSQGYGIMVGCMVGSSLAMAPAMLVAQDADIVDLDGPLLLAEDRDPALVYEGSLVYPPEPALWG